MENSTVVFGVVLFAALSFGSALFWVRVCSRAGREDLVRKRRRLWQAHLWFGGLIAILLAALTVLAAFTRGDGLLIVFFLAIWCAAGFAVTVSFTLLSYPVEFLLSRGARPPDRPVD